VYRVEHVNDVITVRLWPPQVAEFTTVQLRVFFSCPPRNSVPSRHCSLTFSTVMSSARFLKCRHSFLLGGTAQTGAEPQVCIATFESAARPLWIREGGRAPV